MRTLQQVLQERGHDVTRAPTEWMPLDASDEMQLLGATAHGRIIFTFSIGDFMHLARTYPEHHGIIVANQRNWTLSTLIATLDKMLLT